MQTRPQIATTLATVCVLLLVTPGLFGQTPSDSNPLPSLVEVYWQSTKTIVAPGVKNLVVLDPDIAQAETGYDTIVFTGVERGETVALADVDGKPVSIRVRVVQKPVVLPSPSMLARQEEMAQGSVSNNVEVARLNGNNSVGFLTGLAWSQLSGDGRFDFSGQFEDNTVAGGHTFNIRTATANYNDPGLNVQLLDFNANIIGTGNQPNLASYSFSDFTALRGASVTFIRGNNEYTAFGGVTVPYFYLSLGATRDVTGFTWRHKVSKALELFSTTSYVNAPVDVVGQPNQRRNNVMQDAGAQWHLNQKWTLQGVAGISNHGGMARAQYDYVDDRLMAYGSAITSSVLYPTNQLGALLTGASQWRSGFAFRNTNWLTEAFVYQHQVIPGYAGITTSGSADYLSPSVTLKAGNKQDFSVNYTYSHDSGGFSTEPATGNRVDTYWRFQILQNVSNSAQFSVGSLQDPLQLNSEDEYLVRDSFMFPIKTVNMFVAFEHDQTNPSLVAKLRDELNLLSPELQNLFLSDPIGFVNSPNFPPEIRALLQAQNPVGTSFSIAAQLHSGTRLQFGPSFSIVRSTNGQVQSWSPYFGYGFTYSVNHGLMLTSSLTNQWVLANSSNGSLHTSLFSFGLTKNFVASPEMFSAPFRHPRVIEGRVFRDNLVRGVYSAGDGAFPGVQVRLDTGEATVTDPQGRYKFLAVSGGLHQVSLEVAQFGQPVRMTTKSEVQVDLIRSNLAVVNFGVVDFARVLGSVFNDLRFEGTPQPDSKGMSGIRLVLNDGKTQRSVESEGGEFQLNDVPPGDYTLEVDPSTLPPNYVVPKSSIAVHVSPVSSLVVNIPVHALRSIAGRVFLKVPDPSKSASDFTLVPMAGIQLSADDSTTTSDKNGEFLLRHLPAGDLVITVVPVRALPPGMKVPSGPVHMPAEPIEVKGATIVISNPDLVPYLIGKTAEQVREAAALRQ